MKYEDISKIGKCEECFKNKATYQYILYVESGLFKNGKIRARLVCEGCMKKLKSGEIEL